MKYIRTKDGIYKIYDTHNGALNHWGYKVNKTLTILLSQETMKKEKFADTIDELCDEFVIKVDNEYLHAKYYAKDKTFYIYNTDEEISLGECLRFNYVVKGAIWTDKGLIYVAKMNDKGKLELL